MKADEKQEGPNAFEELMTLRGKRAGWQDVALQGTDPFYPTPYRIADTIGACMASIGVAANDIWEHRTGRRQRVSLDVRQAAATLRTLDYTRRRDEAGHYRPVPIPPQMAHMHTMTQPWRTRDGQWFLAHFNLPHLERRVLDVLQCGSTAQSVREAIARRDADELEEAIAAAHACGGRVRTADEWLAHPQGRYLSARPVIEITRIGDAPARPFLPGPRPLSGVRVLDLTRILAGPIAGRSLAEHGADVLMVTAKHLPQASAHVRDTSHGKRSCFLDFREPVGAERLRALVGEADVFIDGYRHDSLSRFDLGADDLLRLRPGLVHLTISCYGSGGPFAARAGWEQVAQAVTGICQEYGALSGDGSPKLVKATMCDYSTGYLGALGVLLALERRAREGGSYRVHVSLCQSAMLIQRQPRVRDFAEASGALDALALAALSVRADTVYGDITTLGPVLQMSETPPFWARPTPRLGGDEPRWLDAAANPFPQQSVPATVETP